MNDKRLKKILERLDKLDQLEARLQEMKTEYAATERLKKIETDLCTTKQWVLNLIRNTATLYEIVKNNGEEILTKR